MFAIGGGGAYVSACKATAGLGASVFKAIGQSVQRRQECPFQNSYFILLRLITCKIKCGWCKINAVFYGMYLLKNARTNLMDVVLLYTF